MLKKTIVFDDLDGKKITEDFYFNLNQAELAEWELRYEGGLENHLRTIVAARDGGAIIAAFRDIIAKTVGKRSEDGRRFIKTKEISDEFMETDAYSRLFIELVTDANAAANFIKGVVPAEMSKKIDDAETSGMELANKLALEERHKTGVTEDIRPAWEREDREPTHEELIHMSREEMSRAMQRRISRK